MSILNKAVRYLNRNTEEKFWHNDDVEKTKHLSLP